uniref:polysaccharide pyruvyl transferase family protein n=1 Tax=Acetatifactor sp. TaxID=1872090 RepID=UPI004056BCF3
MKAGILSLYYNNANYGGLLQAYALTKALNKLGLDSEQICYNAKTAENPLKGKGLGKREKIKKYGMNYLLFVLWAKCKGRYRKIIEGREVIDEEQLQLIEKRTKCLKMFEQNVIPHSDKVYHKEDIKECVDKYDLFVCGSDQVWNPSFIRDEYLLKFVPSEKTKIAYAASISRNDLTEEQRKYICNAVMDFDAVSVREKSAVSLLATGEQKNKIVCMPDPTFLLAQEDWNQLIEKEKCSGAYPEEYILCYFLGESRKQRKLVQKIAQKNQLKIVSFPHVLGKLCYADLKINGAQEEYECSPARFIDLIKHAKYVITDSFHATVFSLIYQREFIVLQREKTSYENSMISRLLDLLEGAGLPSRLVSDSVSDISKAMSEKCDFTRAEKWLAENRKCGMDFLQSVILQVKN